MEFIKDLFWSIAFTTYLMLVVRTIFLLLVSLFIIWIIRLITVKTIRKHNVKREDLLKISLQTSLVIYFVFFCIYLGLLIKYNGLHQFQWSKPVFYLGILPVIITYLTIITIYIFTSTRLNKQLKRN